MANKTKASKWKKYLTKRKAIVLGVFVLAVVAGSIVYIALPYRAEKQSDEANAERERLMKVVSPDEISGQIDQEQGDAEKAKLYLDLASVRQRDGDPEAGLEAALKSIELQPTHEAYASAGAMYISMSSTEQALDMFKKAMELTEKVENPNQVSFYNDYRLQVIALEGGL